ncbi:MAG: hypothetical protein K8J08_17535 [Thermoanaerobaculia bacterium]|nr:hypothetical protein [Thermoanaerobaculia bacterium]
MFDPVEDAEFENERQRAIDIRLRRKYRQRGWPAERIERVFAESKRSRQQPELQAAVSEQAELELAISTVANEDSKGLYLLVHQFAGLIERERFAVETPAAKMRVASLNSKSLKRDRLYFIAGSLAT